MICIRVSDGTQFLDKTFNTLNFLKGQRKGREVKHFVFDKISEKITFVNQELKNKLISKHIIDHIKLKPIYIITTFNGNSLAFQDINNSVKFLRFSNNVIELVSFDQLNSSDTIICCKGNKKMVEKIKDLVTIYPSIEDNEDYDCPLIDKSEKKVYELSRYIVFAESKGIVANNILLLGK